MKKIVIALLVFSLVAFPIPASAVDTQSITQEEDSIYERQVAAILADYYDNPEAAVLELEKLDIILLQPPSKVEHIPDGNMRQTYPSDYTLTLSAYKRSNSSVFYLQFILEANAEEPYYGPLDFVSIEWDTACASYYASSGDGTFCTVQSRGTGIVVFNLEDHKLTEGDLAYGTVRVDPIKSGWMDFGSKYVHTYATSMATSQTASVSYSPSATLSALGIPSLGLSYTEGYQVVVETTISQWQLWTDNSVNLYFS